MKKQILATAMAIVSVGSLNIVTPTAASCKPLEASIIEINEQNESEFTFGIKDPRMENLMKQVEEQKRKNQIEAARRAEEKRQLELKKEQERIDNVKFDSYDIGNPSGVTHQEMANVLMGSGFEEFSDAFVDAEIAYGVNAFALAAIPGLESGWNRSGRAKDGNNNIVGMNVPHNASRGTVYNSKYQCIMDLARQLRTYYLTPGGSYYNGVSTSKVNIKYSADPNWYTQVDKIGDELMQKYSQLYR